MINNESSTMPSGIGVAKLAFLNLFGSQRAGGNRLPNDEHIKARIAGIFMQANEKNLDITAGLILALIKKEYNQRWILIGLSVITALSIQALCFCLLLLNGVVRV